MVSVKLLRLRDSMGFMSNREHEDMDLEIALPAGFGARMAARREELGMTQGQLAQRLGVTQATMSQIETGVSKSSSSVLRACKILGMSPPYSPVGDVDEWRWIVLGKELREHSREFYDCMVAAAEAAMATARRGRDEQ